MKIEYQTPAQGERLVKLNADVLYRTRVAQEVADPLLEAKAEARRRLLQALREIGVNPKAEMVIVKGDGVFVAGEDEVWSDEANDFVPKEEPKKPAKRTARPRRGGGKK